MNNKRKKMKIAFLNLSFGKANRGAETFVLEVSQRLRRFGHKVKVISVQKDYAPRWPILWRVFLDPQGIQVLLFSLRNLPKIFLKRYDVVIPVDGGWQPALVRLATWLYGGRMIISGQSGKGWDDRNNLWCFPDTFVAISTFAKTWAGRANPLVKSIYIPNGVDLNKFKIEGKSFATRLKKPIVLCVGALTPAKRIDLTIKAVAELDNVSLLVVGDGDLKRELVSLGEKFLGTRFSLVRLPFAKMPEVYRSADVFTIPSRSSHSFEIVLVEAMATGLGVVATNDPIRREIVGDTGILVDPTNIKDYSLGLRKALETNWGDKPREQAEKFDWDKIAEKYEKLFSGLVPQ